MRLDRFKTFSIVLLLLLFNLKVSKAQIALPGTYFFLKSDTLVGKVKQLRFIAYVAKEEFGNIKKTEAIKNYLIKFSQSGRMESIENALIDKNLASSSTKFTSKLIGDTTIVFGRSPDGTYNIKNLHVYSQEKIIEERLYNNDSLEYVHKYSYDKTGKIVEESSFNGDGSLSSKKSKKFDFNNRLIESENFSSDSYFKQKFIYDLKGRLIKCEELDLSDKIQSTIIYKYNNLTGKLIEKLIDNNGIKKSILFMYDTFGRMLSKTDYHNGKIDSKEVFLYDKKGWKIESTIYSGSGKLKISNKSFFSYLPNGLLQSTKEISFWENSRIGLIRTKTFEYDKVGNYVKLIESSSSRVHDVISAPEVNFITEREIEYY